LFHSESRILPSSYLLLSIYLSASILLSLCPSLPFSSLNFCFIFSISQCSHNIITIYLFSSLFCSLSHLHFQSFLLSVSLLLHLSTLSHSHLFKWHIYHFIKSCSLLSCLNIAQASNHMRLTNKSYFFSPSASGCIQTLNLGVKPFVPPGYKQTNRT